MEGIEVSQPRTPTWSEGLTRKLLGEPSGGVQPQEGPWSAVVKQGFLTGEGGGKLFLEVLEGHGAT